MTPGGWIWNYRGYAPYYLWHLVDGSGTMGACPLLLMTPGGLYQHYNKFLGFYFTKLLHLYCLKIMEDRTGSFGFFAFKSYWRWNCSWDLFAFYSMLQNCFICIVWRLWNTELLLFDSLHLRLITNWFFLYCLQIVEDRTASFGFLALILFF